jgi:hypothetical protein
MTAMRELQETRVRLGIIERTKLLCRDVDASFECFRVCLEDSEECEARVEHGDWVCHEVSLLGHAECLLE